MSRIVSCSNTNRPIRIGFTEEEPFAYSCLLDYPTRCENYGIDLEYIYNVIYGMFHLNVSWSFYKDFDDLSRALDDDEIDLIGNTRIIGLTSGNNETWYQTFPVGNLIIGFLVKTVILPKTLYPLNKFTWDLWLAIMALTSLLYFLKKSMENRLQLQLSFIASKFFYFFWFVILSVIMDFYGNMLTADLITTQKTVTSFTDLDDLGRKLVSNQCQFAIFEKYIQILVFDYVFKPEHNLSWSSNFRNAFITNPPILVQSKKDLLTLVRNSKCVVGLDLVSLDTSPYASLCDVDVKVFVDDIPVQRFVYYHKTEFLNSVINTVIATDSFRELPKVLLKRHLNVYTNDSVNNCQISKNGIIEMTLSQLFYYFIILLVGIVIAGAILVFQNNTWFQSVKVNDRKSSFPMSRLTANSRRNSL